MRENRCQHGALDSSMSNKAIHCPFPGCGNAPENLCMGLFCYKGTVIHLSSDNTSYWLVVWLGAHCDSDGLVQHGSLEMNNHGYTVVPLPTAAEEWPILYSFCFNSIWVNCLTVEHPSREQSACHWVKCFHWILFKWEDPLAINKYIQQIPHLNQCEIAAFKCFSFFVT